MVITDQAEPGNTLLLLDERVNPVHLSSDHAAMQFIERLGWAISDAEEAEQVGARRPTPGAASGRRVGAHRGGSHAHSALARNGPRSSVSDARPPRGDSVAVAGNPPA
jgi:hypothetical protein